MLQIWMPEANGVWQWSSGEYWVQANTLEDLIQAIQLHQGEEAVVYFPSRDIQMLQQQMSKAQYKQLGPEGIKFLLEEFVVLPIDAMKVLHHFQQPDRLTLLGVAQSHVETLQHALA